jgi:hypothetical protein
MTGQQSDPSIAWPLTINFAIYWTPEEALAVANCAAS